MLTQIEHPFQPKAGKQLFFEAGHPLGYYLEACGLDRETHIVICNGAIVPFSNLDEILLREKDDVVIRPLVMGGGGGKMALRLLVMAGVAAASFFTAGAVMAAAGPIWAALAVGGIAAAGAAIQTFLLTPSPVAQQNDIKQGWDGPQTLAQQGLNIPKPYGKFINAGNCISSYVETVGNLQYLNVLLSLGLGRARALTDIRINNNPIDTYTNLTYDIRLGRNRQSVIPNFSRLVNSIASGQRLRVLEGGGHSITILGTRTDTDTAEFDFYFPSGLWAGPNSDSSYDSWAVAVQIEYQKVGDPAWTPYIVPGVLDPVDAVPYWLGVVQDYRYANGQQVVVDTSTDPRAHHEGQTFTYNVQVTPHDANNVQQNTRTITLTGTWKKNPKNVSTGAPDTGTVLGTATSWDTTTCRFESNQGQVPQRFVFSMSMPSRAQWNWRLTKLGSMQHANDVPRLYSDDNKLFEDYSRRGEQTWLQSVREISNQVFTYPNQILLGLRVMATDQLSGSNLNITCNVEADNAETQGYTYAVQWDDPSNYWRLGEAVVPGTAATNVEGTGVATYNGTFAVYEAGLVNRSPQGGTIMNGDFNLTTNVSLSGRWGVELLFLTPMTSTGALVECNGGLPLYIRADGKLAAFDNRLVSSRAVNDNLPHHVAIVVDGDGLHLMLDGVVDQFSPDVTTMDVNNLSFGRTFVGVIQEVATYDYDVQLARIRKHYLDSVSDVNMLESYPANSQPIIVLDMALNRLYGGSTDVSNMDLEFFKMWADRCATRIPSAAGPLILRHEYNNVIDNKSTLWDAMNAVAHTASCTLSRSGIFYSGVVDMPDTPRKLYNVANASEGSFEESWANPDDRANSVDIIFYDENNFYRKTILTVQIQEAVERGLPVQPASTVDLRGCTSMDRAWHYGNFLLKSSQLLIRTMTFRAPIDSLSSDAGDVVMIQHDLPQWGYGGKLRGGCTTAALFLDKEVPFDTNVDWLIMLSYPAIVLYAGVSVTAVMGKRVSLSNVEIDDVRNAKRFVFNDQDRSIVNCSKFWIELEDVSGIVPGTTIGAIWATDYIVQRVVGGYRNETVFLTSALPHEPKEFTSWTYGSVAAGTATPFHVVKVSRKRSLEASIDLIEYQDEIYVDEVPQLSAAAPLTDPDATVTGLIGVERFDPIGENNPEYAVSWQNGPATYGANVYVSRNGGPEVFYADALQSRSMVIPCYTGDTILVRVVGYDNKFVPAPYNGSPTVSNYIDGFNANPTDVTGFIIGGWNEAQQQLELSWNSNPENNIDYYSISFFSSLTIVPTQADCDKNEIIRVPNGTHDVVFNGAAYKGRGTYAIRAVNTLGKFSITPSRTVVYTAGDIPTNDGILSVAFSPSQPWTAQPYEDGTASITMQNFTELLGVKNVPVNVEGQLVGGLSQGTGYYFYFYDPDYVGGSPTIHATTDPSILNHINGRLVINAQPFVTPVWVPAQGSMTPMSVTARLDGNTADIDIYATAGGPGTNGNKPYPNGASVTLPAVTQTGLALRTTYYVNFKIGSSIYVFYTDQNSWLVDQNNSDYIAIGSAATPGRLGLSSQITAYFWNDSPRGGAVATYIWKNPNDGGSNGTPRTVGTAQGVYTGSSLTFDNPPSDGSGTPAWQQYTGGSQVGTFNPFPVGSNFNVVLNGTISIPSPGAYTITYQYKDDVLIGIGGDATWQGKGSNSGNFGQTMSVAQGLPLLPHEPPRSGDGGVIHNGSVQVTFNAAGDYPIEVNWDYWYHSGRTLDVRLNGQPITL